MIERLTIETDQGKLVGNLHLPEAKVKGAVIVTGPLTSVKEQAGGAYASALAELGFAALAIDHLHFGESDGVPRQYENPNQKIADLKAGAEELKKRFPDVPVNALGVCAGAGYMAGAVAGNNDIEKFAGVAGFYHDAAQSREWMGDGYDAAIEAGSAAREKFEKTGDAAMIPAVAMEGDRAMPMDEAFEFYGTDRGGETSFPNYKNQFAVMSREMTTPYDSQEAAKAISQPVMMIHSEKALAPVLAQRFHDNLAGDKSLEWVDSVGQIDFYDDPKLITPAAKRISAFFGS